MCGIAGIVAEGAEGYRDALARMVDAIAHRGPDGAGAHTFDGCALGHRRLSIVDLKTGEQPMLAADGALAITFNGEIYGYRELRRELDDYDFRTTSDTEVMLALYQRHGAGMMRRLPGMFAFAIWDDRERVLFAARDRFGEKPFYYARGRGGEFVFASEIKALIASGLVEPKISRESVSHYLRYLYVHPSRTIYSNVFVLPPAHYLLLKGGRLEVERYWELPPTREPLSAVEAVEEFRRLFERAVERQLVADVPVGAFLSGGLDSSSVVAAASRLSPGLKTFSFGFRDSVDELPFARSVAERCGTEHVELEDSGADIADLLVEMSRVYDEPFADSSNIPTYLISQAARRHAKVVLTGDGGDELLGGYAGWYRPLWEMERVGDHSALAVSLAWRGARLLSGLGMPAPVGWRRIIRATEMRGRYASVAQAHATQKEVFTRAELSGLNLNGGAHPKAGGGAARFEGTVDDAMRADLCDYMPGDILVKVDRASMAHGLELRAPFLDVDFASFCVSLPSRLKITEREEKWVLRRAYEREWPEPVRARGKCGFGAPVSRWLKRPGVAALKRRVLDDARHPLFSLVPFEASRPLAAADSYRTWSLLVLGLWLERAGGAGL